jgi:hypothetical protein
MAVMISEPVDSNPMTEDWQRLLSKLTATTGGLFLLDFTEKQSLDVPMILAGSRFELNGSFYKVENDEEIQDFSEIDNGQAYVYAESIGNGNLAVQFYFDNAAPTFQVAKGGWYHPAENKRCIMSCFKENDTNCRLKALMGCETPFYDVPVEQTGVQIATNTNAQSLKINIEAGWYRVEIKGANGGNGGTGGSNGAFSRTVGGGNNSQTITLAAQAGTNGSAGSTGQTKTLFLWLEKGTVELKAGRTGANGANGGVGTSGNSPGDGGNGGDGGDGEESLLLNNGKIVASQPGANGGQGGYGRSGFNMTTPATITWTMPNVPQQQSQTYHTVSQRLASGANGANGSGYQNTITGAVTLFAL